VLKNVKNHTIFSKSLYDSHVIQFSNNQGGKREMKNLKQWLLVLMASFMLVGVATGCSNEDTNTEDGTNTEETPGTDEGTGTEEETPGTDEGTGTEEETPGTDEGTGTEEETPGTDEGTGTEENQ
jgi:hypothetical protein